MDFQNQKQSDMKRSFQIQLSESSEQDTPLHSFCQNQTYKKDQNVGSFRDSLIIDQNLQTSYDEQEISYIQDFKKFTSWSLNYFNNKNILTVLTNQLQKGDHFKSHLLKFLKYFTDNFLKIGNISTLHMQKHDSVVKCVAFSHDDLYFCSGGRDGFLNIYQTDSGKIIKSYQQNSKVLCCHFSPIEILVIIGSKNKMLTLYNLHNQIWQIEAHNSKINCVEFSQSGSKIVSGSDDNFIKIWDLQGKQLQIFTGHRDGILSVSFWKIDEKIISGGKDKYFRVWNVETRNCEFKYKGSQDGISDVRVSRDLETLAFTDMKEIHLWCPNRYKELSTLLGHENLVRSLNFAKESDKLCSAAEDNQIRIWNLNTRQCEAIFTGIPDSLYGFRSAQFSNNGYLIVSGSYDGIVNIWEANQYKQGKVHQTFDDEVLNVKFSSNDKYICSVSQNAKIRITNIKGQIIGELTQHQHPVTCVQFSPDNTLFCTGSEDKTCIIWDLNTMKPLSKLISHRHDISSVSFSPDGSKIATGSIDKTIKIWDVKQGKLLQTIYAHDDGVSCVIFIDKYQSILSCSYDQSIKFWSEQDYSLLQTFTDKINQVCYGDDRIFSCSDDKTIMVWSYDQKSCQGVLKGHEERVFCVIYSEKKKLLCSGSDDKTIRCWNIETMICSSIIYDQNSSILCLDFSSQGNQLICGDKDGYVILRQTDNLNCFIKLMNFIFELQKADFSEYQENQQQQENFKLFLQEVSPQIIKTQLPMELSVLHYALYMNDIKLLKNILNFAKEHELYILPTLDICGQSPFHLAKGNRDALTLLVQYYGDSLPLQDALVNQGSTIFVEFLPLLLQERIPNIIPFLNSRIFQAQGAHPIVGEYFDSFQCFPSATPSYPNYPIPDTIKNKSTLQFQVLDTPNILRLNHPFLKALISLPQSNLFSTPFIDYYVTFKWNTFGKRQFQTDFAIYLCIYCLFLVETLYLFPNYEYYSVQRIIISAILCSAIYRERLFGGFIWVIILLELCEVWLVKWLRGICIGVGMLGLVNKFRGFENIGFAVRILVQAIKDIRYIFLVIALFVLLFTCVGYVLQDMNQEKMLGIYDVFKVVFRIVMYDFDNIFMNSTEKDKLYIGMQMFFFLSSFVMTIVLVELLIGFMCDTFDRVLGSEKTAKNYEQAQLIYKYEKHLSQKVMPVTDYLIIVSCISDQQQLIFNSMRHKLQVLENQLQVQQSNYSMLEQLQEIIEQVKNIEYKVGKRIAKVGKELQWQECTKDDYGVVEAFYNLDILQSKIFQLEKIILAKINA